MYNKSVAELSAGLQNGDFSSEELTQTYLERIGALDKDLNAFISVTAEQAEGLRTLWYGMRANVPTAS